MGRADVIAQAGDSQPSSSPWEDPDQADLTLWLTCASLFLGAYIPGVLALLLPHMQDTGHLSRTISAGLLLSAGLCVVLPEGFDMLAEAQAKISPTEHVPPWSSGAALLAGFLVMAALGTILQHRHVHPAADADKSHKPGPASHRADGLANGHVGGGCLGFSACDGVAVTEPLLTYPRPFQTRFDGSLDLNPSMQHLWTAAYQPPPCCPEVLECPDCEEGVTCTTTTTLTLTLPPNNNHNHNHNSNHQNGNMGDEILSPLLSSPNTQTEGITTTAAVTPRQQRSASGDAACAHAAAPCRRASEAGAAAAVAMAMAAAHVPAQAAHVHAGSTQALLALVIHSAADGLAVGAAALSKSLVVSLTVAISVMVHKMPVAYGLASFLRGSGRTVSAAHRGLLMFTIAAPVAALLTYYGLGHFSFITDPQAVSLVLLASGGTVLHAGAVHVLPGAGKSPLDFLVFSIASLVPLVTFAVVGDQDSG